MTLRLVFVGLLCALFSTGCRRQETAPAPTGAADKLTPIVVQLDWVAEPEHGGFYQAQETGLFRAAGLDVTLIPGGPNALATQKTATGQVQVAQADSTNTILAIAEGLPVVQFAAVFQNDPSVLLLHGDSPIKTFADLNGRTLMARPEWAFLPYLKKKYGIEFSLIPQNFSVANFIADPNFIQQGYYIAEPYFITQGGAKEPKYLFAWDAGWDSYTVLIANREWAAAHPEAMRAFTRAYIAGWKDYLQGDPTPAHEAMKKANSQATDAFLAYSRQKIIEGSLVTGRSEKPDTGRISPERFTTQIRQLRELNILRKDLSAADVMTTDYLP